MKKHIHLLLLLIWLVIGYGLRFSGLASLPPWTDECATIVFSLGNSFKTVPLNQVISSDILLQPLIPTPEAGIGDVIERLFNESTHPPFYFILTHLWMKLFANSSEIASVWVARSLSAFFGVLSIPAMFGFGYLAFRSKLLAHIAAAIIAVSPYSIFLAREARHYTLIMLLVIASLSCFIKAIENIHRQQSLPLWVGFFWTIINIVGVATHYFFALTLLAEGLVLFGYIWHEIRKNKQNKLTPVQPYLWRILLVAIASFAGCLIWLPIVQSVYGSEPTEWVVNNSGDNFFAPLGRLLLWVMSIFSLLPSAPSILPNWVIVISGVATLIFLVWITAYLVYGLKVFSRSNNGLPIQILTRYTIAAIALFLFCTYILNIDLTLAARFIFVFAPAIILLVSALLTVCWQGLKKNTKLTLIIIWLMALIGGITAMFNLGYLQNMRPDLLASLIQKTSQVPVLITTTHKHHGQTGRMMSLAWEFKRFYASDSQNNWQFFLAGRDANAETYTNAVQVLQQNINQMPRPLDLWLIDFRSSVNLKSTQCFPDQKYRSRIGEYSYKLYHCE
ncbi:glycosyltransferase family 39 protein [Plectonema cf. radiosum LEGE 06105]|uniref:Glycosyltransferase family 39 protein n=1 Tax=Plectonema cf. radiosum LEGE 06105 TaxID=945769 RepID=A0A8J7EZB7_9CYAN|nr:glycosyltransferase family 39 protein [Plectonema radiosum]MBE9211233.1 glycosyltransferase family 39 protein [Plectonema cf. radiosum LEGE 06105]